MEQVVVLSPLAVLVAVFVAACGGGNPSNPAEGGSSSGGSGGDTASGSGGAASGSGGAVSGSGGGISCMVDGKRPSELVDPFIGVRDSASNSVLGPQLPFGSINPSPDTPGGSHDGYAPSQPIRGFSQLHASGTGWGKYGQILVSPQIGLEPDEAAHESPAVDEVATPAYYGVTLSRYGIRAEVAPAHYSAIYRFSYPASSEASLLIDITHAITRDIATEVGGTVHDGQVEIDSADPKHITGWATHEGGFGSGRYTVHFAARVDREPVDHGTWRGTTLQSGSNSAALLELDERVGLFLQFETAEGDSVHLKLAVSLQSVARAEALLAEEIPEFDFAAVKARAEAVWDDALGRVCIEGGSAEEQTIFYTALYRSLHMPRDRSADAPEDSLGKAYWDDHYAGWDTWRTVFPLMTLLFPERTAANIKSYIERHRSNGVVMDTFVAGSDMDVEQGGNDVDNVIVDAFVKGVPGVSWEDAYGVIKANADSERQGLAAWGLGDPEAYRSQGWLPAEANMSCSYTLEYSYNDYVAAVMASALGHADDASRYAERANSWLNLFNADLESEGFSGWVDQKASSGEFLGTDPKTQFGSWGEAFYEGSSWTYSFFVPHDFARLIELAGGRERFAERLHLGATEGLIDYSNEPGFMALRAFHYALRPDRCSEWVRKVMLDRYSLQGFPGNEDSGAMGSWYVFSALGFFPNAGQPIYLLNGPLFPRATLTLGNGHQLVLEGVNASRENVYIQSCMLDDEPLSAAWLFHGQLAAGGVLRCEMGAEPSAFGTTDLPPSFSTDGVALP